MSDENINNEIGIDQSPLFVGLTRPTSLFGLPLNAFVANMVVITVLFLLSKNIFVILLGIPTHYYLRSKTNKDFYIFDNLRLEGMTKGRSRNKKNGTLSFSPTEIRKIKMKENNN